jgi:hypothetical protein
MAYLWLFHYAIIQKLAKKRFRNFPEQMSLSAFTLLCIISVSIFAIFVDKSWLASLYHKSPRLPIGPIFKSLLMIFGFPFYIYFSSRISMKDKLNKIRKIIMLKKKIMPIYSIIYVCCILCMFILGVISILLSFPIY